MINVVLKVNGNMWIVPARKFVKIDRDLRLEVYTNEGEVNVHFTNQKDLDEAFVRLMHWVNQGVGLANLERLTTSGGRERGTFELP
jgi:hypothetical protein